MSKPSILTGDLCTLFASLPGRRRTQFTYLALMMVFTGLMEMLVLGSIVPFLAVLADPDRVLTNPLVMQVSAALGWHDASALRTDLAMLFAGIALAGGIMRFAMVYLTSKLNFRIGHEIGIEVYRRSLSQPYEVHLSRSSSEILGAISKVDNVVFVVFAFFNMCSGIVVALFIAGALVMIEHAIALVTLGSFGLIYAIVSLVTRQRMATSSEAMNRAYGLRVQAVQDGLGGIRDVLLDQTHSLFLKRFDSADRAMRDAQASIQIIAPSPRIMIEALGIMLIAALGYLHVSKGSVSMAIPTLGALALGAQRLMPLLQQSYQGWIFIVGSRDVLAEVVRLLRQPVAPSAHARVAPMPFEHAIRLNRVKFEYGRASKPVLSHLDMEIRKGDRIGIVGSTGSGKSTAMDLLLGLLQPTGGQILIDGVPLTDRNRPAWQRNVAHVPQAIFLTEASFAENIAFGIPADEIDIERVKTAAKDAQIADYIESMPHGYQTLVGERGINLSGGQRQRIGIARALYKRATVLVFDEATSALDGDTELAVMEAIRNLGPSITIILIAHRITTLQGCTLIYRFREGGAEVVGGYDDLVARACIA